MFASMAEKRRFEMFKKNKEVTIFNQKCLCKHRSDEHIAGDGNCFLCECGKFTPVEALTHKE